ncbi:MAG TPA: acyl carrier protein [Dehalococcoidia bacterium]|nr:acyl carrier protein [Dehalococcoidia bacterium]
MDLTYEQVMADTVRLLTQLGDDWEYSGTITPKTGLIVDLGMESLELVVLGVSIQEHYERTLPFEDLLTEVGEKKLEDIYVGDLVAFIHRHLAKAAVGGSH